MKKFLSLLAMLLVIGYLLVASTAFSALPTGKACRDVKLIVKDGVNAEFISQAEVVTMLKTNKAYPVGKLMEEIRTDELEELLSKHPLVENVECYKTPGDYLCVEVSQRIPLLRIMSSNGEHYYIDNKGKLMTPGKNCLAHCAIVTGHVDKAYAIECLYPFGLYLQENKFWGAQIEQIHVDSKKEVELVPRVDGHIICMGKLNDFEQKLQRLKMFYEKGLSKVGWNKYSRINVEFANQIICTKKD